MSSEIRALLGLRDNPMQDCGEVNTLLEAHIQQVEMRVSALLQLKRHLVDLREKCSGVDFHAKLTHHFHRILTHPDS